MSKNKVVVLHKNDQKLEHLVSKVRDSLEVIQKEFVGLAFNLRALHQYARQNDFNFSSIVSELGLSPAKAIKLVNVADMMVKFKNTIEDVKAMGYTKASTIAPVLSKKNYKQWIASAHKLNTAALREAITKKRPPKATIIFTANLTMKQNRFVLETLVKAGAEPIGSGASMLNRGAALVAICEDFHRNNKGRKPLALVKQNRVAKA